MAVLESHTTSSSNRSQTFCIKMAPPLFTAWLYWNTDDPPTNEVPARSHTAPPETPAELLRNTAEVMLTEPTA